MKKNILVFLPIFFLGLSSFFYSNNQLQKHSALYNFLNKYSRPQVLTNGVIVGHRTSDSTANVSISKSDIQQNIIATIPELDSASITDDPVTIKVNHVTGYLLFNVNNAAGVKMVVGLELIFNSNDLIYPLKSGRQIHICKSTGTCNSCQYIFSEAWIVGCRCSSENNNDNSLIPACKDAQTVSQ